MSEKNWKKYTLICQFSLNSSFVLYCVLTLCKLFVLLYTIRVEGGLINGSTDKIFYLH